MKLTLCIINHMIPGVCINHTIWSLIDHHASGSTMEDHKTCFILLILFIGSGFRNKCHYMDMSSSFHMIQQAIRLFPLVS